MASQSYPVVTFYLGVDFKIKQMAKNVWWLLQDSSKSLTALNFRVTVVNYHRQDDYGNSCPELTDISRHALSCSYATPVSASIFIWHFPLPFSSLANVYSL